MKTATFSHAAPVCNPPLAERSLTSILFSRSLLVGIAGLLLYSAFEIVFDPPKDLLNYFTHHFAHVVGIGVAVWWVCWWVVRENVLAPLSAIAHHLHRLRSGRLETLAFQTRARETQAIVTGVNSLTDRLRKAKAGELERALTSIQELRGRLSKLPVRDDEQKVPVMRCLTRLESSLLGLMTHDQKRNH